MGILRLPGLVQTQQPQSGASTLDWSNPLLRSTTGLWQLQNGFYIRDSVSGAIGSIGDLTNVRSVIGQAGIGLASISSTSGRYVNTGRLASSLGISGTSNRTIYGVCANDASAANQAVFTLGVPSTGQDWTLRNNGTNAWRFNIWGVTSIDFTYAVPDGGTIAYVCTQNGTAVEIWINGQLRGSGTATVNTTDAVFKIGGDASFWSSWQRPSYFSGVANRVWAAAEKKAFCNNPWQIFKSPQRVMMLAGGLTVTYDGILAAEWSSSLQRDVVLSAEFSRAARADALASAEWTGTVSSDSPVQLELAMTLRADRALPTEWTGAVSIAADSPVPLEWRAQVSMDARAASDWLGLVRADALAEAEFGALVALDARVPVALTAGLLVDGVALADWTGAVAVSGDARMQVEWSGGVTVTATALLPIEFGAGVAVDARVQASWSAAFIGDRQIPAEFNTGVIANQQGALDWLRTVFGDAVLPGETLMVIAGSASAPAEFGGVSAFLPGNTEIFRVDARGYIWRVDARSTTWCPEARRTVWLPGSR